MPLPSVPAEIVSALENFGLSSYETKVYLSLLSLGQTTAGPLVRRCGFHRQYVYAALTSLEERGLVSYVVQNNRRNFFTNQPELLLQQETTRFRQIQSIVPQLKALGKKGDQQVNVQVFHGLEGFYDNLFTVIDSAARFDNVIRVIGGGGDSDPYSSIGAKYQEYIAYQTKKKVCKYLIASAPPGPEHIRRFMKEPGNRYRYLPQGLSAPSYTRITPEVVTVEIFGEDTVTLQIWNKTIARSYLENFEALWKVAVPARASRVPRRAGASKRGRAPRV